MCVAIPIVLGIVGVVLSIASTASAYVIADRNASNQDRLAKAAFNLEKQGADAQAAQIAEAAAAERLAVAEEAARSRGIAKTAGLGESSLRNLLLDVSRREGRSNAIVSRNLELVALRQMQQTQGSLLSLSGKMLDIDSDRPSAAVTGLLIGTQTAKGGLDTYKDYKDYNDPKKP